MAKVELSVADGLDFSAYSAYLDGYVAGAAVLVEHLKRTRVEELAKRARAKAPNSDEGIASHGQSSRI